MSNRRSRIVVQAVPLAVILALALLQKQETPTASVAGAVTCSVQNYGGAQPLLELLTPVSFSGK